MQERELVKIASDNPAHPNGYYTQFKDRMQPGDVIFDEAPQTEPAKVIAPNPTNKKKVKK